MGDFQRGSLWWDACYSDDICSSFHRCWIYCWRRKRFILGRRRLYLNGGHSLHFCCYFQQLWERKTILWVRLDDRKYLQLWCYAWWKKSINSQKGNRTRRYYTNFKWYVNTSRLSSIQSCQCAGQWECSDWRKSINVKEYIR